MVILDDQNRGVAVVWSHHAFYRANDGAIKR